ncbi:hypothetical protein OG243_13630 [Streptomyces sp. NBC_01318]|uniref:hypothetical protein n=1 Tax=Streptomyces sp. NBC_01318 TaxID=2903823 RepID=UPI002E0FEB14|nr:hypothetical protein OG243_13630 [Streptomyces sp. NBC_01318]
MNARSMNALAATVATLASLVERFPDLPAADAAVSTIFPHRLALSFHGDLGKFEAWRSALRISYALVSKQEEIGGPLMWLNAETVLDGITVRLTGYGLQKAEAVDQAAPWEVAT